MENNQDHKIDKIFRETFENQEITPPSDAWMGIHTYTIGQEESKRKVWFRYASLALLLLVVSGLGFWYFVDNHKRTSKLLTQKVIGGDTYHGGKSSVRTQTTALYNHGVKSSVRTQKTALYNHGGKSSVRTQTTAQDNQSPELQISGAKSVIQLPKSHINQKFASSKTVEKEPLIIEVIEDSSINNNTQFEETVSYFNDNNIHEIKSKPLILNDLVNRIQKENESKIVALKENIIYKKEVFKVDSVEYGGKISLRHPIISYGFGMLWNFWDVERQVPLNGLIDLPNRNLKGANITIGIAWKIYKKLRVGMSIGINSYDVNIPVISTPQPLWSSATGVIPVVKLVTIYSDQFYQAETPFGNVNLPVSKFKDFPTVTKNVLDEQRQILYFNPHRMNTISFSINSQFDILSKIRKNKGKYGYQFYGITDLVIQRQYGYSYSASDFKKFLLSTSSSNPSIDNILGIVNQDENHLQNASEFVFGLRAGLGFRYQFAQKWDFFVEGSGQHSLNNWVKSEDIKTFQRALSLQAGINLNL